MAMEQRKPEKLFRFFPPEASDFFSSKKLWFSSFKDFNDPFEMLPCYDDDIEAGITEHAKKDYAFLSPSENISWNEFKRHYKKRVFEFGREELECVPEVIQKKWSELFGIICLVGNPNGHNNLLMWGHYAKGHSGFVVEFDPKHKLFQIDGQMEIFGEVEYSPHRPAFKVGVQNAILMKGMDWKDESEYRLIKTVTNLQPGERVWKGGTIKKQWYLDLPTDLVLRVYFGCRMLDSKREEMIKSLESAEWNNVEPFVMRIHRTNYEIEPIPLKEWKPMSQEAKEQIEKKWEASLAKYVNESDRQWIKKGQ